MIKRWFYFIFFFILLLVAGGVSAQNTAQTVRISEIDASNFPDVTLNFRALDADGSPVANLDASSVSLLENNQPISDFDLRTGGDAPAAVVFVIDRGRYSIFNSYNSGVMGEITREAMTRLTQSAFLDGTDSVGIVSIQTNEPQVDLNFTTSAADFSAAVNSLNLNAYPDQRDGSEGLTAIQYAIDLLLDSGAAERGSTAVIYIGRLLENTSQTLLNTTAEMANAANIPVHTFSARCCELPIETADQMQTLSTATGGQHFWLDPEGSLNALDNLYQSLNNGRLSYTLSYRSASGVSGARTVTVRVGAEATTQYEIDLLSPVVTINEPQGGGIERTAERPDEATAWTFNVGSAPVSASVTFPDNITRTLVSAELLVDGIVTQTLPNPDPAALNFTWDFNDLDQAGEYPRVLSVRVTDELGLNADSTPINMIVNVNIPEAAATIIETTVVRTACEENSSSIECIRETAVQVAPYIGLLLLTGVLLRYRRQVQMGVSRVASRTMIGIRNTIIGKPDNNARTSLMTLEVLDGPPNLRGSRLELFKKRTTIGRDPAHTDMQIFSPEDTTSVSRKHCTIEFDESLNGFVLMDEKSAAGTRVNNRVVGPKGTLLQDGDVIEMGDPTAAPAARLRVIINAIPAGGAQRPFTDRPESAPANPRATVFHTPSSTPAGGQVRPTVIAPKGDTGEQPHVEKLDGEQRLNNEGEEPKRGRRKSPPVNDQWLDQLGGKS